MKSPAFQFYPGDWQRDLSEHPLEIEGAWIRICCALWWSETPGKSTKPLTNWARVLRVGEKKSLSIITYLLNQNIAEVIIQNSTITISSRRMIKDEYIRNVRRNSGLQGGNPSLKSSSINGDLLNQNLVNQNPTPSSSSSTSTSNNTPPTPRKRGMVYADDFLEFWKIYPKKIGKDAALRAWKARNGTRPPLAELVSAVTAQLESEQWQKENGQFIPNPATWLNQGRWADEVKSESGTQKWLNGSW